MGNKRGLDNHDVEADPTPTSSASLDPKTPNWKKIDDYKKMLKIVKMKPTEKEKIAFKLFDVAITKSPANPWIYAMHTEDFKKDFGGVAMLRKAVPNLNSMGITKKFHKRTGNQLVSVTLEGLGILRNDIVNLTIIKDQYPPTNEDRGQLELRIEKRNKVLSKYERRGFGLERKEQ